MTVHAVLFDLDGTLLDSRDAILAGYRHAVHQVTGHGSLPMADEQLLQLTGAQAFTALAGGDEALAGAIGAVFQRRYAEVEPDIRWYPGAIDVLRALDVPLAIVTSKARRRLDLHLATAGVAGLFAATVSADESPRTKPDPAPVRAALEMLAVQPESAVFVGDGASDVDAARGAGVRSVGAGYGFHPDACRAARPDHWITAVTELPDVLARC